MSNSGAPRRDSRGRDIGNWQENYRCTHCDEIVVIPLYAAWPDQCPHCRVWRPRLEIATDAE